MQINVAFCNTSRSFAHVRHIFRQHCLGVQNKFSGSDRAKLEFGPWYPPNRSMIHYEHGSWGLCFLWQLRGSTLPKGLIWALPWSAISGYLCYLRSEAGVDIERIDAATLLGAYGFFISLLAFMVAFRNNQGWSRYWEGATLLQQTRGEWFNAVSSVFAFCNPQPDVKEKVNRFQVPRFDRTRFPSPERKQPSKYANPLEKGRTSIDPKPKPTKFIVFFLLNLNFRGLHGSEIWPSPVDMKKST